MILKVPWGGFLRMGTGLPAQTGTLVNGDQESQLWYFTRSQPGCQEVWALPIPSTCLGTLNLHLYFPSRHSHLSSPSTGSHSPSTITAPLRKERRERGREWGKAGRGGGRGRGEREREKYDHLSSQIAHIQASH